MKENVKKLELIVLIIIFIVSLVLTNKFLNNSENTNEVKTDTAIKEEISSNVDSLYNEVSIDSDVSKEENVGKVIEVTDETFQKEVLESDKKILVEFYADWCGPCKKLSPILEEIAKENVDLKVVKVNVDDNTDLAAKYGTNYIPLLVVIEDGIEVNKGVGALSKEDILELVK